MSFKFAVQQLAFDGHHHLQRNHYKVTRNLTLEKSRNLLHVYGQVSEIPEEV